MFTNTTKAATLIPIFAAIYFTCRGFIGLGMTSELVAILTLIFASLSWLLSQSLLRFIEVKENGDTAKGIAVAVLGMCFLLTEAALTHIGLEWMLQQGSLHLPAAATWFFSIVLSLANVLSKWAFMSLSKPKEKTATAAGTLTSAALAKSVSRIDAADTRTLSEIAKQVANA